MEGDEGAAARIAREYGGGGICRANTGFPDDRLRRQ
jgi:hypothetical protein